MGSICSSAVGAWDCKAVIGVRRVPWIREHISRIYVLWYKKVPLLRFGFVDFILLNYTLSTVGEECMFPEEISRSHS